MLKPLPPQQFPITDKPIDDLWYKWLKPIDGVLRSYLGAVVSNAHLEPLPDFDFPIERTGESAVFPYQEYLLSVDTALRALVSSSPGNVVLNPLKVLPAWQMPIAGDGKPAQVWYEYLASLDASLRPFVSGNDVFTKLLLHCDGTNGAASFPDASASGHAVGAFGSAQVDTSQSVFGGASVRLGAAGNYLASPDSDDWAFGSSDFTVDLRARFSDLSQPVALMFQLQGNDGWILVYDNSVARLKLISRSNSGTVSTGVFSASPSFALNTWYHLEFVRHGASGFIFRDGLLLPTTIEEPLTTLVNVNAPLAIGGQTVIGPAFEDEIRISKGIARHTESFTVPSRAYG